MKTMAPLQSLTAVLLFGIIFQAAAQDIPPPFRGEWLGWRWQQGRERPVTQALIRDYCRNGTRFTDEETELTIRRQFVREQYAEGARDFNRPKLSATTPDKIAGTLANAYDHSPRPHRETFEWRLENGNTLIVRNGRQPAQTFYRCR